MKFAAPETVLWLGLYNIHTLWLSMSTPESRTQLGRAKAMDVGKMCWEATRVVISTAKIRLNEEQYRRNKTKVPNLQSVDTSEIAEHQI